jgi:hypothetical protein
MAEVVAKGWQPRDSRPKTGEKVVGLIASFCNAEHVLYWDEMIRRWVNPEGLCFFDSELTAWRTISPPSPDSPRAGSGSSS